MRWLDGNTDLMDLFEQAPGVGDAIQPSPPLSPRSPPAFNLSQLQGLFQLIGSSQCVGQSIGDSASASVLPMNLQD